jgi:hypothetical protein
VEDIDAAGGHGVGDVSVKILTPRSAEEFLDSYWMMEVTINSLDEFACDRNKGQTIQPFPALLSNMWTAVTG